MKIKQKSPRLMSDFICNKDTLAVINIFLAGFYLSNKVNFQNYSANKLIRFKKLEARVLSAQKHYCSCFSKHYFKGQQLGLRVREIPSYRKLATQNNFFFVCQLGIITFIFSFFDHSAFRKYITW